MKTLFSLLLTLCSLSFAFAQGDAKQASPPDGKSLVYFVRPSKLGTLISFITTCDDKMIGRTKGNRFLSAVIDPGTHKLITSGGEKDAELDITTEAGKTYFVEIIPKMGLAAARIRMELVSEDDGRKKLEKCKAMEAN